MLGRQGREGQRVSGHRRRLEKSTSTGAVREVRVLIFSARLRKDRLYSGQDSWCTQREILLFGRVLCLGVGLKEISLATDQATGRGKKKSQGRSLLTPPLLAATTKLGGKTHASCWYTRPKILAARQ